MRIARAFALGLAAFVLAAASHGALAGPTGGQVDVGHFLAAYAKALKIELPKDASAVTLLASLKASGVKVDAGIDLGKPLEQGDVARIGRANGLRISTTHPESAFTSQQVDQFFGVYGQTLAGLAGHLGRPGADDSSVSALLSDADHANTDKGKKKGRPFNSPVDPGPKG